MFRKKPSLKRGITCASETHNVSLRATLKEAPATKPKRKILLKLPDDHSGSTVPPATNVASSEPHFYHDVVNSPNRSSGVDHYDRISNRGGGEPSARFAVGSGGEEDGELVPQVRPSAVPVDHTQSLVQVGLTDEELVSIRATYLGLGTHRKQKSEKVRNTFQFEWNNKDDTTIGDTNPLYAKRLPPQLLFGRGFLAGVDVREQRRTNNFYDKIVMSRDNMNEEAYLKMRTRAHSRMSSGDESHWSSKSLEKMTERDWRIFREDFQIQLKGGRVPPPARNWAETRLPAEVLKAVERVGYTTPSAIQMQSISIAMELRDMIGIAETGSGKTAAFCLPLLAYLTKLPHITPENASNGPYALILAPSRELAQQIEGEFNKFAQFLKFKIACCVGGVSIDMQAFLLHQGVEVVVGTPGRLKDILENSLTVLNRCYYVVLDEADKMIDLGFEEVVTWIMDQIPDSNLKRDDEMEAEEDIKRALEELSSTSCLTVRLTHLFSATMPQAVQRIARKYLRAPCFISIGDPGSGKKSINQLVEFVAEGKKVQKCISVLNQYEGPIIVFTNLKKVVDVLVKKLLQNGFNAVGLHGGKTQEMRQGNLEAFKKGECDILVATDVAGRGIDVEGITLVVNLDFPKDIETYTHRIGRTGRAGKSGTSISFLTDADSDLYYDLRLFLEKNNQVVPRELAIHEASKQKPGSVKSIKLE
eukprot:GHVH01000229.1.p1 GENE.GHVH01000229.1~~GHVH01000229.1.p1  ORF type:complete len:702 (+),score=111.42 GHVH01000229.1:25-2130(+)